MILSGVGIGIGAASGTTWLPVTGIVVIDGEPALLTSLPLYGIHDCVHKPFVSGKQVE